MSISALRAGVEQGALGIFGELLLYTPQGGQETSVVAFFAAPGAPVAFDGGTLNDQRPRVLALRADVPNAAPGDRWTINGQAYVVTDVPPDDGGIVSMMLREE